METPFARLCGEWTTDCQQQRAAAAVTVITALVYILSCCCCCRRKRTSWSSSHGRHIQRTGAAEAGSRAGLQDPECASNPSSFYAHSHNSKSKRIADRQRLLSEQTGRSDDSQARAGGSPVSQRLYSPKGADPTSNAWPWSWNSSSSSSKRPTWSFSGFNQRSDAKPIWSFFPWTFNPFSVTEYQSPYAPEGTIIDVEAAAEPYRVLLPPRSFDIDYTLHPTISSRASDRPHSVRGGFEMTRQARLSSNAAAVPRVSSPQTARPAPVKQPSRPAPTKHRPQDEPAGHGDSHRILGARGDRLVAEACLQRGLSSPDRCQSPSRRSASARVCSHPTQNYLPRHQTPKPPQAWTPEPEPDRDLESQGWFSSTVQHVVRAVYRSEATHVTTQASERPRHGLPASLGPPSAREQPIKVSPEDTSWTGSAHMVTRKAASVRALDAAARVAKRQACAKCSATVPMPSSAKQQPDRTVVPFVVASNDDNDDDDVETLTAAQIKAAQVAAQPTADAARARANAKLPGVLPVDPSADDKLVSTREPFNRPLSHRISSMLPTLHRKPATRMRRKKLDAKPPTPLLMKPRKLRELRREEATMAARAQQEQSLYGLFEDATAWAGPLSISEELPLPARPAASKRTPKPAPKPATLRPTSISRTVVVEYERRAMEKLIEELGECASAAAVTLQAAQRGFVVKQSTRIWNERSKIAVEEGEAHARMWRSAQQDMAATVIQAKVRSTNVLRESLRDADGETGRGPASQDIDERVGAAPESEIKSEGP